MGSLRIEDVSKQFGDNYAVRQVDLTVADGEFLVLLGPSGCGKSTLLRMIAGLDEPSSGRILLDDRDITDEAPQRRNIAMVFQSYALYPHLSVAKNIGFPLRAKGVPRAAIKDRVSDVAASLGLTGMLDRRPANLSGGQRQRVALARAMVREPGAFLMDEPLSNLDAKLRTATRAELIELHRSVGATFVYVTHDQVEAMTMASRIALLNNGSVEQIGTPAELYDTPRSTFVAGFLGSPPMNLFQAEIVARDGGLRLIGDSFDLALPHLAEGFDGPLRVTAGIRPEKLRIGASADGLHGVVTMIENLGSEELVHVDRAETPLTVRLPRPCGVTVGDRVVLAARPDDVHIFDAESGHRLRWDDATADNHMTTARV